MAGVAAGIYSHVLTPPSLIYSADPEQCQPTPAGICNSSERPVQDMENKAALVVVSVVFSFFFASAVQFSPPKYSGCHSKDFGHGGTVCVCSDELECDSFSEGSPLPKDSYAVYTSSKAGDRFNLRTGKIKKVSDGSKSPVAEAEVAFTVNQRKVFQKILGFGGAFTGKLSMLC